MRILALIALWAALGAATSCCGREPASYNPGDIKVTVEAGGGWLHKFPLFMGINIKNPPQIAMWVESSTGDCLSTIYASQRAARGSWRAAGGDPRAEALPVWNHARRRGGVGSSSASEKLPSTDPESLSVDAITGATPKGSFEVKLPHTDSVRRFVVKIEINHSRDWNDSWPEGVVKGEANYSAESGQPSLVWSALIDLDTPQKHYIATLAGHGSPDGSDGEIRRDTSTITSALDIAKSITIDVQ